MWVWLVPFRSAGKNTRQCLWNETHLGDATNCFCFDLAENVAHAYRNMNTHLSGCLIIKEESPGGLLYIGARVPCGVLLQIPHSPIITTINHDTQPPAPGVGWEEVVVVGLLPALNTCDSSATPAVYSEAEGHMEVSELQSTKGRSQGI